MFFTSKYNYGKLGFEYINQITIIIYNKDDKPKYDNRIMENSNL